MLRTVDMIGREGGKKGIGKERKVREEKGGVEKLKERGKGKGQDRQR